MSAQAERLHGDQILTTGRGTIPDTSFRRLSIAGVVRGHWISGEDGRSQSLGVRP